MYETYRSTTILDNGFLTVQSSSVSAYIKWVNLRHVATAIQYIDSNDICRLSLNLDNGDIVHIEGEQTLIAEVINTWTSL
jgi:hypothetical protein